MAARTPDTVAQPLDGAALDDLPPREKGRRPRAHLRIERRSCRPLDLDNFAGGCKALIDCLREAQIIDDDDPESVEITFTQTRVKTRAEEGTALSVSWAPVTVEAL